MYPGKQSMVQAVPSSLVHGNTMKPLSGGLSSGHSGGSQIAGLPVHSKDERQIRCMDPLREYDELQSKLHVPLTVCLLQSMAPFSGASSRGHLSAANNKSHYIQNVEWRKMHLTFTVKVIFI